MAKVYYLRNLSVGFVFKNSILNEFNVKHELKFGNARNVISHCYQQKVVREIVD